MSESGVLVCGAGAVTTAGTGVPALSAALAEPCYLPTLGLERPDAPPLLVATCRDFSTQGVIPPLVARRLDRPARLLVVAARESLETLPQPRPWANDRMGVCAGTWNAGTEAVVQVLQTLFQAGPEEAPPMQFPSTVANAAASQLGILERLAGPNLTFFEKQVGGMRAVAEASRLLRRGRADAIVACGVDEAQWLNAEGYHRLGALAAEGRAGFTLGEGAAALLLAKESVLPPLARIRGWGAASTPTTTYMYPTNPDGLSAACQQALAGSGIAASDIGLVLSLANGSPILAELETRAMTTVLGAHRPAALAVADRLGEGAFSSALRVLVAVLVLAGRVAPAWSPPCHLADAGFAQLTARPGHALVTAVAGGGAAMALVISGP